MKKLIKIIIFILICIPIKINAREGITNYYIDAKVLDNGDVNVREIFTMNGTFNGMNRIIDFKGSNIKFDGTINSFKGSDIYNGDSIIINEIKGIPYNKNIVFEDINKIGDTFKEVINANKGNYGVYTKDNNYIGIELLIYNPSSYKKAFYIDYTITNMAIIHNDIAELGFNIFTNLTEYVDNLEMHINIPNNKEMLRVWAHGPLYGESKIIDNNNVKVFIKGLEPNTPIDVRLAFDKEAIKESKKFSNTDALEKIITLETKKANEANEKREQAKEYWTKLEQKARILLYIKGIMLIGLIYLIIRVYKKYDKEYESTFKTGYFRDFPSSNSPTNVGYLIRKQINNDDLSASILMLIYKKVLKFEKTDSKKEDYALIYNITENIDETDKKLLEFLFMKKFVELKDNDKVILSVLKKLAQKGYAKFLRYYTKWKEEAEKIAKEKKFFENKVSVTLFSIVYAITGIIIGFSTKTYAYTTFVYIFNTVFIIIMIIGLIYFSTFTKRTREANEEYQRWMGLKRFMKDFGTMDKKDLPEIVLWEKYLVYAVTLGCADKLAKTMKIRATEFQDITVTDALFDYNRFQMLTTFNHVLNNSINNSVSSAYQARNVANSSHSSGSGSGGGFSGGFSSGGGGGSFGGGGGGGRF